MTFYRSPALAECFPSSEKIYNEVQCNGNTVRVPFRRIFLEGGSGHLDVPDTSGPQVLPLDPVVGALGGNTGSFRSGA